MEIGKRVTIRVISFVIIIFASLLVIAVTSFEYNETFAILSNIVLSLNDVKLLNENDVSTLSLKLTLSNPSAILKLQVRSFSLASFLNLTFLKILLIKGFVAFPLS